MIATVKAAKYTSKQKKLAVKKFRAYKRKLGKRVEEAYRVKEILASEAEKHRSAATKVSTNFADQDYYGSPAEQH